MHRPSIVFLHSHNTGRYVQPYGHAVPTANLQKLAEEGVLFRHAFAAAPTCSPSRGAIFTGRYPHAAGILGLGHRGFSIRDPKQHLVQLIGILIFAVRSVAWTGVPVNSIPVQFGCLRPTRRRGAVRCPNWWRRPGLGWRLPRRRLRVDHS